VNKELVDLGPLTSQTAADVRALVERHLTETDSAVAAALLADWSVASGEFTAVVPRDYKRVMDVMRAAEAAGRDVDAAVMEVVCA
jgi:glutamate synthase (NADPH/NADH) large chain